MFVILYTDLVLVPIVGILNRAVYVFYTVIVPPCFKLWVTQGSVLRPCLFTINIELVYTAISQPFCAVGDTRHCLRTHAVLS